MMGNLITGKVDLAMTSLEVSELVESRHDSVKRAVERLAKSGVLVLPQIEDVQFAEAFDRKRIVQIYQLDKRSIYIVVAQLSPEFTARLVDRWQELENKLAQPAHQNQNQTFLPAADRPGFSGCGQTGEGCWA